jgi:uncharacterized membrane protein
LGEIETIAKGDGSRLVQPRRFVVHDPTAFSAIWEAHAGPDLPVPPIDFDSRMVAAVFGGERPTPGYELEITGVRRDNSALVVVVEERFPDPSLVSAQIIVSPFHIVSLPRDDGVIRFSDAAQPHTTLVFKPPKARAMPAGPATAKKHTPRPSASVATHADWLTDSPSSTGLTPAMAATMAYLAGPFSGALLLATEPTNRFVRFHAWQALFGLGVLGTAAVLFLVLAFVLLLASPTAFWVMLWLAAATAAAWLVVWALCLRHAYKGHVWKLPYAGDLAERYEGKR